MTTPLVPGEGVPAWSLDGLDEEQTRRALVPSGTNLAGLLKHVTYIDARWIELCFADVVPDGRLSWPTDDYHARAGGDP